MFLFVYNFFKRKYIHRRQKIKILWRDPLRTLASTPHPIPHASPMHPPCVPHATPSIDYHFMGSLVSTQPLLMHLQANTNILPYFSLLLLHKSICCSLPYFLPLTRQKGYLSAQTFSPSVATKSSRGSVPSLSTEDTQTICGLCCRKQCATLSRFHSHVFRLVCKVNSQKPITF